MGPDNRRSTSLRARVAATLLALAVVALPTTFLTASARSADAAPAQQTHEHPDGRSPNAVIAWNQYAGEAAVASCLAPGNHPPFEARMYAVTQLAVHDALQAIRPESEPYLFHGWARGASPDAAVAAAAHDALVAVIATIPAALPPDCITAGTASVEEDYARTLASLPRGRATERGLAVGRAAAAAVLAARAGDGSDTPMVVPDWPQGTQPGEYRFTPGTPFAFAPGWGEVTPFALTSNHQFTPGPPYALTSAAYAADLNEIKRLGGDGVTTPSERTPYQTQTALFWLESSPLSWNRIGRTLAVQHHLDLWESARMFGLLDAALADGYIASFHTKWDVYRFWRPVTAIQLADTDGNPATSADPTWTPLATTPPIPDYESAHAVEGAAAAAVFRGFFGTGRLPFAMCSNSLDADQSCTGAHPVWRWYDGPASASTENGISRILVGFHFRLAVDAGLVHGGNIGRWTVRTLLGPRHHF